MTLEERKANFISLSKKAHEGENLDYSKVVYVNNKTPVTIIDHDLRDDGTEYGEYTQLPLNHIKGMGHPEKSAKRGGSKRRKTWEELLEIFRIVHEGENLEYPEQEFENIESRIRIIDHDLDNNGNEYGEFWQEIHSHMRGSKHPRKAIDNRRRIIRARRYYTDEEFKEQCRKVWGDRYDLSEVNYEKNKKKIKVICREHGPFNVSADNFKAGHGCPKCASVQRYTTEEWVEKVNELHGGKYDYSKTIYTTATGKVTIICPKHGEFSITANKHMSGRGCPKCGRERSNDSKKITREEFVERSNKQHNNSYDYSIVDYVNNSTKVNIICGKHGIFKQTPASHLNGCGCPKCAESNTSRAEDEITEIIESKGFKVERNLRSLIGGKEIDIYIPEKKIGIEYDGLYWHSERTGKMKDYHIGKLKKCNEKGIKLVQIFEDEWIYHKDIVADKIMHILGISEGRHIGARKTEIREITIGEARDFLETNHIQGYGSGSVHYGAYTNENELVGVMSFKKEASMYGCWELVRFATKIGLSVAGLGGKMLKKFVTTYNPTEIKSFADRRWTTDVNNNLYTKIGFILDKVERPDYRYVVGDERKHKFGFRKQKLSKKYGLPMKMTEKEMCDSLGFYRIWDCGLIKYVYKNENATDPTTN